MPNTNTRRPCDICGAPLPPKKKRLCSPPCKAVDDANRERAKRARNRRPDTLACKECAALVPQGHVGRPREFCDDVCKIRYHSRRSNWSKVGLREGLGAAFCRECDDPFIMDRRNAVYCSTACYRKGNQYRPPFEPFIKACENCGSEFTAKRSDARFCSTLCKNRDAGRRRMRTAKDSFGALAYSDQEIFERDGWRCHLCGKRVSKTAPRMSPTGATIDHLVPRSLGGVDAPSNVATAHRQCNVNKNTRAANDQLRLS
jgi:5-methylcytosine-specific restriction endonuclease McrA